MEAHVTAASQSYKVREYVEKAEIRHGQTARVDIPNVRVAVTADRPGEIYFCNMRPIRVKQILSPGDQGGIPTKVALDKLEFPSGGTYDIIDVLISTNGEIRISADRQTRICAAADRIRDLQGAFTSS
jgi:hypothetical protein